MLQIKILLLFQNNYEASGNKKNDFLVLYIFYKRNITYL